MAAKVGRDGPNRCLRIVSPRIRAINMLSTVAQPIVSKVPEAGPSTDDARAQTDLALLGSLPELLTSGGDDRLRLAVGEVINNYGCAPLPLPKVDEFASSTATTISDRAYSSVERARIQMLRQAAISGFEESFDARIEEMRQELRTLLGVDQCEPDIIFAPSGTDSALHATLLASHLMEAPLVNILMAPDETGSGVPYASIGQHFSGRTALGVEVEKGRAVKGFPSHLQYVGFSARGPDGTPVPTEIVDRTVIELVVKAVSGGAHVLLHAMDCSRTGISGPSLGCLDFIVSQWPGSVQVVVDACQMRLSRGRLRSYLARRFMVMITGSKFFTGPPFSGALLVPRRISDALADLNDVPSGLLDYTGRASWPRSWPGVRAGLTAQPNFGEWLRWEAALEEMRAYFAVPSWFRTESLKKFENGLRTYMSQTKGIRLIETNGPTDDDDWAGQGIQSLFPFVLERSGRALSFDESVRIYQALNDDIRGTASGSFADRSRLGRACHFGQPVGLTGEDGLKTGVLRVSASARMISEAWGPGDRQRSEDRLRRELNRAGEALERIAFLATRGS